LDASIYNCLVCLQEKVIENAEETMEQSNTGFELQVVIAIALAPAINLDNPSGKYFSFKTQWGNNFLLPFEPCKAWEVCQV
jgi:ABC-type tungstate transport system substrate-binding protein